MIYLGIFFFTSADEDELITLLMQKEKWQQQQYSKATGSENWGDLPRFDVDKRL